VAPLRPRSTLFPYTTLFRSLECLVLGVGGLEPGHHLLALTVLVEVGAGREDGDEQHADEGQPADQKPCALGAVHGVTAPPGGGRSEEHTSELQSRSDLVCRL